MLVPGLGLGVTVQLVPFHDSTRVRKPRPPVLYPTASHWVVLVHETAWRPLPSGPGLGVGVTVQADPFQLSANDPAASDPTVMQKVAVGHETLISEVYPSGFVGGMTDQVVPVASSASASVLLVEVV